MKNLNKAIESEINNSDSLSELKEKIESAIDSGFEFGSTHILEELPVWGAYRGDTTGIFSWDENNVLDGDFNIISRCGKCRLAQWACECD